MPATERQKEANNGLTDLEDRFVDMYVGEAQRRASTAARLAGYKQPHVMGCKVLARSRVREAVRERTAKIMEETGVTPLQIQANALHLMAWAEAENDRQAYAKGNEQLGRTIAAFTDKRVTEDLTPEQPPTDAEREAWRAAAEVYKSRIVKEGA